MTTANDTERLTALDAFRVLKTHPEHLITSADTENRRAGICLFQNQGLKAAFTQPAQIGHRALRAGKNDHVRIPEFIAPIHIAETQCRMLFKWSEIRKI